jgi:hypothetical protein
MLTIYSRNLSFLQPVDAAGGTASVSPSALRGPALDAFSARAGADVSWGSQETCAVFRYDAERHRTQVAVYGGDGRLVRMIPPGSVAELIAAMAAYRRLR